MAKKVSALYLFFGILWIITGSLSLDYFAIHTLTSQYSISLFEISKGLLFVFFSTLLLYFTLAKAIEKQKKTEIQYKKLFNESPIPIWIYDTKTLQFLAVNEAAIASYDYSESQFLNMTIQNIYPEEDWENFQKSILTGKTNSNRGIWRHRNKSGELFLVDIHSNPIEYYQYSACLVSAINVQDKIIADKLNIELGQTITEYKEHVENQNRNLREIAWAHSHKLRAPVANILGLIPLLNRKEISDPINVEILDKIMHCTKNLDIVIHEIVEQSKTD